MKSLDDVTISNLKAFERALMNGTTVYKTRKPSARVAIWYLKTHPKPADDVVSEIAFRYFDSAEVQEAVRCLMNAAEVHPRQVRGEYIVLSIWADGIDDPTWLCCELAHPDWTHTYTVRESELLASPLDDQISEDDRLRMCRIFFDKLLK